MKNGKNTHQLFNQTRNVMLMSVLLITLLLSFSQSALAEMAEIESQTSQQSSALCSSAQGSYTVAPHSTSGFLYNTTQTGCPNLYVTPDQDGWAQVVYLTSSGTYVWKDWQYIYAGQSNEMGTDFISGVSWWVRMWNGYSYSISMSFSSASGSSGTIPSVGLNCIIPWTVDTNLRSVPSNITGAQLDAAVRSVSPNSPLIGLGNDVVTTGNRYGINPVYIMAHAAWESAWGTSYIAQLKNNLFGFGAYDHDPVNGAYTYDSFAHSVNDVMAFVDAQYLTSGGSYYTNQGSTLRGMNVHYATDTNWGNGIASVMNSLQNYLPDPTCGFTRSAVAKTEVEQPASISAPVMERVAGVASAATVDFTLPDRLAGESTPLISLAHLPTTLQESELATWVASEPQSDDGLIGITAMSRYQGMDEMLEVTLLTLPDGNVDTLFTGEKSVHEDGRISWHTNGEDGRPNQYVIVDGQTAIQMVSTLSVEMLEALQGKINVPDSDGLPTAVSLNNLATDQTHTFTHLAVSLLGIVAVSGIITRYAIVKK